MKQILIAFDETNYNTQISKLEDAAELIQEVVICYGNLNLPPLNNNDLSRLFKEPAELIFNKMTDGEPLSIGNAKICKTKAIEILEKPIGYEDFLLKVKEVNKKLLDENFPPGNTQMHPNMLAAIFELNDDNVVQIKQSQEVKLKEANKKYAQTDAAKCMFEFGSLVLENYKRLEINKLHPSKPLADIVNDILESYSDKPQLKIGGITKYNSNTSFKHSSNN